MPPGSKTPSLLRSSVVSIPGRGDLSPPRRQTPVGRWLVAILVFVLLAGGGYAAFLGLTGGSSKSPVSQLPLCPLPAKVAPAQTLGPLRVVVNNATQRDGLAAEVGADLGTRGFHVTKIGNAAPMSTGVATVHYSADRRLVAAKVAAQITGSTMVAASGRGVVILDIGPKFHALATPKHARAAYLRLAAPPPAPTPTGSCRPQTLGSPSG
jgi:LytR cell envelope-related transcriptional attenuator